VAGPVWVVSDLSEETFVEISVPRIFGTDRSQYVARQLINRFPETRVRTALAPRSTGSLMNRLAPGSQTLMAVEPGDRLQSVLEHLPNPLVGVWSASMLLAHFGAKSAVRPLVFVVMSLSSGLRIVFLRNKVPVLTRLVPAVASAAEQASEILRTVRHLENTRVIERDGSRLSALLLGTADGLASMLTADRFDALVQPLRRRASDPTDWRHILFDLVCKRPPGQLAGPEMRVSYLGRQVAKAAYIAVALCLVGALGLALEAVTRTLEQQREAEQAQANAVQLAARIAVVDAAVQAFGVAPDHLRQVIGVERDEIARAPDLQADLVQISGVASALGLRSMSLQWSIVPPGGAACTLIAEAPAPAPAKGLYTVELQWVLAIPPELGPHQLLQAASNVSRALGQLPGATVLQDPAKTLRQGAIGARASAGQAAGELAWCLALQRSAPGAIALQGANQ
jgi:hypothetical protein